VIASTLRPLMKYIPGPRGIDVAVLALGMLAIVALVGLALSWPLRGPFDRAMAKWPETRVQVDAALKTWSEKIGISPPLAVDVLMGGVRDFLTGQGTQVLSRGAEVLLGIALSLVFTLVGSIFLLSDPPERLIGPALRLLAPQERRKMQAVFEDLPPRYRAWVVGTIIGMSVVFAASLIGYLTIGVKVALPLALMAGFAEIVPTVGPAVACLIAAVVVGATQGGTAVVGVLVVWGIIQAIEAYIVLPLIMRGAVNVHPAVTLFSVVLWGKLFGVPGLMLAIPINLTIWTMLDHFRMRANNPSRAPARVEA
jgi:predicted PurR-regulated permease PerM